MTDARVAREAAVVAHKGEPDARVSREAAIVAHNYPPQEAKVSAVRGYVCVSRGLHGWDIIQRDRGTH